VLPYRRASSALFPRGSEDQTVVATVDGTPITQAEVDARAAGPPNRLRYQEYEPRRNALEVIVEERILDRGPAVVASAATSSFAARWTGKCRSPRRRKSTRSTR
jgi:hypothetical protein